MVRAAWALWLSVAVALAAAAGTVEAAEPMNNFLGQGGVPSLSPAAVAAAKAAAPELFVSFADRVEALGYPLETHTVRTEDGYLLTVHRIPRGRGDLNAVKGADAEPAVRPPVLLFHGLFSNSEFWVLGGPSESPALMLADKGYDVWMANARGNHYSRSHETLQPEDPLFWNFSSHEMGFYDVPAMIDYILGATGQTQLYYVGHSSGALVFLVAMSTRPEYNSKVRLELSLAPAAPTIDTTASTRAFAANTDTFVAMMKSMNLTNELFPKTDSMIAFLYYMCRNNTSSRSMCLRILSTAMGDLDPKSTINLPFVMAKALSGTSAIVLLHFAQNIRSGVFQQFDYGVAENMKKYGTPTPPAYNLDKVTAPIALYAAEGDPVVKPSTIEKLSETLPNVVVKHVIKEKYFNHFSFGIHPKLSVLLDHMLETMKRY